MKKRNIVIYLSVLGVCLFLSACGMKEHIAETPQQVVIRENVSENDLEETAETDYAAEIHVPSKEDVLAMRELVLEGMSDEEIERLTENIKVANLRLESAYLNDNIFDKLLNKDSLYWNYFDKKGDIQIGWAYDGSNSDMKAIMENEGISESEFYEKYGEPVIVYNRFDAANFINLIQDMQKSVHNEMLIADLQQLIDLTSLSAETHEMEYANEIYKILHDLDYFLLRYGIEDVGKYTRDGSVVSKYYGVLTVYGATPFVTTALGQKQTDADVTKERESNINSTNDVTDNHEVPDEQTDIYNHVLEEYSDMVQNDFYQDLLGSDAYDSSFGEDIGLEIRTHKQEVYYAFYDIDGNGIKELIIAGEANGVGVSSPNFSPWNYDLYGYDGTNVVHIFPMEFGYRTNFSLYENGIIEVFYSGSAAESGVDFYKIAADGTSAELVNSFASVGHLEGDAVVFSYFQYKDEITEEEYKTKIQAYQVKLTTALDWIQIQ